MKNRGLVFALAAVFAGMTVLMVALAAAFREPVPLFVALLFGAATYFFWYHATGRIATGIYERVERQARANAGERRAGGAGFGAGPREDWERPGGADRWERVRQRSSRRAGTRQRSQQRSQRPPTTGQRPSDAEARRILGVDAGADQTAIRRAYRERVKETHPDTENGDEERFKRVTSAYERLTD